MKKGFILYRKKPDALTDIDYGVRRLLEAAKTRNIELQVITPNEVELIVTRHGEKSLLINGMPTEIPDFIIPRTGSATTYYSLAVIRQFEHLGTILFASFAS